MGPKKGENGTFSTLQKNSNTRFCRIFVCVIIPRFCRKVILKTFVCRKVIPFHSTGALAQNKLNGVAPLIIDPPPTSLTTL